MSDAGGVANSQQLTVEVTGFEPATPTLRT